MNKLRELFNDARAWFERLSTREQRMVTLTALAVLGFTVFIILLSFSNSASRYQRRTEEKVAKLGEVQALASSYRQATQARQMVEQQLSASNISLISFIEDKATQAGLEVPNMTPKGDVTLGEGPIVESSVEVTFTDVDLLKLSNFLQSVERGPGIVKVKALRMEPRTSSNTLTAWTTVATYRMKSQP